MRRESHVRFCEGLGVRFPRATRLASEGGPKMLCRWDARCWTYSCLSPKRV
jgi:hypothetical protein